MNKQLSLLALAALAGAAQAETGPYYFGASQSFTHESNLFRLEDGQALPAGRSKSDTYSTTALVGGLDQRVGRQRVYGSLSLRANRFSDNDFLNSQTYNTLLGADWETIGNLSGRLEAAFDRNLRFDSTDANDARVTERNVEKVRRFEATGRVGAASRLRIELGYKRRDVDYSLAATQFRNYEEDSGYLGVRWRPANAFTYGVDLRRTEGSFPLRFGAGAPADTLIRNQVDLVTQWAPGGASSVDARLSYGRTTYEQLAVRNFSSPSWAVAWNWQPTGKLKLVSRLYREVDGDSFVSEFADDSTRRTGLRLNADYELSAKILLDASAGLVRRERSLTTNFFGFTNTLQGNDTRTELSLGARWLPTRAITLGCSLRTERRGANDEPRLSDKYSANVFSCFGQFVLQP